MTRPASDAAAPLASVARGLASPRPTPALELHPRRCPLCDADDPAPFFVGRDHNFGFAGAFPVVRCRRCDLIYNHPAVRPADIAHFFESDYAAHDVDYRPRPAASRPAPLGADQPSAAPPAHAAPLGPLPPAPQRLAAAGRDPWDGLRPFGDGRHLDLGCGAGAYLARNQALGWDVLGVDPIERAITACAARAVPARLGTIPGLDLGLARFDLITLLGAIGQLPQPRETLTILRAHAAPDAIFVANAFNAAGLTARRAGPYWTGWDLPRESCHYTPETLGKLLARTGWRVTETVHRRRPNIARRSAKVAALATARLGWRIAAAQRSLTSALSTIAAWTAQADDFCIVARPA